MAPRRPPTPAQRQAHSTGLRARYRILRRSGLCVKCAVQPAKPLRTRCADCLELERRRTEARARGIRAHGVLVYAGHCPSCYLGTTRRARPVCAWCDAMLDRRKKARARLRESS